MYFNWFSIGFYRFYSFLSVSHQCSIYFHRFFIYLWSSNDFDGFWAIAIEFYSFLQLFICFPVNLHLFPLVFRLFYEFPTVLRYSNWFSIEFYRFYSFLSVFHQCSICSRWFPIYFTKFQWFWWILLDHYRIPMIFTAFHLFFCEFPFMSVGFPSILRISNGFNVF